MGEVHIHPAHCSSLINDRKLSELVGAPQENIADDKNDNRKSGKYHMSIIRCPLFPLNDLFQIAPPILHINLGICLKLDSEEGGYTFNYEAAGNQYVHSEGLLEIQKEISSLAHEYIVYSNIGDRLKNIGDIKKHEDIAVACYVDKNSRDKYFERCEPSHDCIVTAYDDNMLEVQCELCHIWKHAICECLVTTQESLEQLPNYICITCRHPLDNRNDLIARQLDIILGLQEELQVEEIDTRREYERIT